LQKTAGPVTITTLATIVNPALASGRYVTTLLIAILDSAQMRQIKNKTQLMRTSKQTKNRNKIYEAIGNTRTY